VTQDDLLYRFRLRVFAMAAELGTVRAACRTMGIHPSTYYRWKGQLDRHGPEILRPRERRPPRMANATSPLIEQRVVAFALGHPGFGPARVAAELARPTWVGSCSPPTGCGGCWVATASRPGPSATAWSSATQRRQRLNGRPRRPSAIWTCIILASWSSSIASASAASVAPRARSGSTPPSTSPPPPPGPPSRSPGATLSAVDQRPGPHRGRRPRQPRLEARAGHERQRQRVPLGHLPADRGQAWRKAYLHPGRPTPDERLCRAGAADHPGRVLEAGVCSLPDPPNRPASSSTWNGISATTTANAPTAAAGPAAGPPTRSSGRPNCGRRHADASPQLGDRTP
jgi:hypothetical protein